MAKNKKLAPPRVTVSAARFHEHLSEQIGYLESSCSGFDGGRTAEFKRIAAAIRTLVHDTGSSTSLLAHLGEKNIPFVNTAFPYDERNLLNHHGLIGLGMTADRSGYVAHCQMPGGRPSLDDQSFEDWWSEPVIKDGSNRFLTRRDLILIAANQDGGSHVDGTIDQTYDDLARQNSLGWMASDGQIETPLAQAEAYSIRQIGWEVLETLRQREARLLANEKCACGSGRKHRYCCGKLTKA
ncbi:YecA family protein [Brevundimonas diminuta]|uniref:YecA family protein n=1 Tax=Brevundimonas diminuta TaxID=293 RepID=UPI000E1ABBED|nr:hypothetical protein [Brevundimonas diminuta]WQE44786.1 hypothetical protein U0020_14500 [Brevundimonas diminuta]SUW17300.1 Uncharacterised protein [Brevundimonas diminuta]